MQFIPLALALLTSFATAVSAQDIATDDAHARILPGARAGAIYLTIANNGTEADRLTGAEAGFAAHSALHTSHVTAEGLMQMLPIADGIAIPPGAAHTLASGGDHIMLMGLTAAPAQGETFTLKLTFEKAGEIAIDVIVDNGR